MKKLALAVSAVLMLLSTAVYAENEVTVIVKGQEIDSKGSIIDARTFVPVRGVFEKLGYTDISWDGETKTATLKNSSGSEIVITNGLDYFTVDGKQVTPDVPQQILNDRFVIPLRAVSEAVGAKVDWDGETKTATIKKGLTVVDTLDLSSAK
ncbi:MAG: copper amine oxidase N-terminal domain-containing protein [Firmicutes bacterium]|nr:copper amine oxidase N-terminal domain-containing protein [Bacillota bacterium]